MLVVNLVSWAGEDFSHAPGAVVELDEAVARGRIAAGLAEEAAPADEPLTEALTGAAKPRPRAVRNRSTR